MGKKAHCDGLADYLASAVQLGSRISQTRCVAAGKWSNICCLWGQGLDGAEERQAGAGARLPVLLTSPLASDVPLGLSCVSMVFFNLETLTVV